MSDSQSPSQPNSPWFQVAQPQATSPVSPNTTPPTPQGQQITAPAPSAPAPQPFMGQPNITPEMQQQFMLAQQMQYQANWLQLHYQQWLMGRVQSLAQLWQQPEAALWSNPQVQLQLQQEYSNTFNANDLYRQAALAVQAMGMFQGSPFGMGGAYPNPAVPPAVSVAATATATTATATTTAQELPAQDESIAAPQFNVTTTTDSATATADIASATTSEGVPHTDVESHQVPVRDVETFFNDATTTTATATAANSTIGAQGEKESAQALSLKAEDNTNAPYYLSADAVSESEQSVETESTDTCDVALSQSTDLNTALNTANNSATTTTTDTLTPESPKSSDSANQRTSKQKSNATKAKTMQDAQEVDSAESAYEDEELSEQQLEMSKLALDLERSRQQISKRDINDPYVDLPFFEEQATKLKMQAEALQTRSLNSTQVKKVIGLFERDDGLFNEANLFLRYIRDERHLSSATVNTYKAILLRAIVILEKVLPHPPAVPKKTESDAVSNSSSQKLSNGSQEASSAENKEQAEEQKAKAIKYRSLLKRSYDGDLVLQIGVDEDLYYEKWGQIELSTFKSLHRELNFGVKHQRRASASVAQNLHALSSFFNYLVLRGLMVSTPMEYLQAPKVKNALPRVLSEREVGLMLDSKSPLTPQDYRDLAMIELLYASGLRVAELVSLDLGDVDFDMREVRVLGKGNKERVVPMGSAAIKAIQAYLLVRHNFEPAPNEKALFLNHLGTRITTRSVQIKVKAVAQNANLEGKVTPHKLRHAFATQLLNNGVNLRMVQEMLGHANLATTQIYTHLDLKRLQDVYSKAHPLASATHTQKEREEIDKQRDQTLAELESVLEVFDPDKDKPI